MMTPTADTPNIEPRGGWLDEAQLRAWIAYMRVRLKLSFEMNRQLQRDSGLSLADYDILAALTSEEHGRMTVTALAAKVGWERSRASHQIKRMAARDLVATSLAEHDRRVTEVSMTEHGWDTARSAAPGHVDLVRSLFFDRLSPDSVASLAEIFETVVATMDEESG